jgi:hypothetical protein
MSFSALAKWIHSAPLLFSVCPSICKYGSGMHIASEWYICLYSLSLYVFNWDMHLMNAGVASNSADRLEYHSNDCWKRAVWCVVNVNHRPVHTQHILAVPLHSALLVDILLHLHLCSVLAHIPFSPFTYFYRLLKSRNIRWVTNPCWRCVADAYVV